MARIISKCLLVVFVPLVIFFSGDLSAAASNLDVIRGGWYSWKPYQYLELASGDSTRRLTDWISSYSRRFSKRYEP